MKKLGLIWLLAGLSCLAAGCASSGKAALLARRDPIALVSVISNGDINWKGEDPIDVATMGPLARRTLRSDPDMVFVTHAEELIDTAESVFREFMDESMLINLAEKGTVLLSQAYQNAQINRYQASQEQNRELAKPVGYRLIDFRDKNFPAALAAETGIDRFMYLEFNFTKAMATGVGKIGNYKANVEMKVSILNTKGKIIYRRTYVLGSRITGKVSSGAYSGKELLSLCHETVIDLCYEFLDHLD